MNQFDTTIRSSKLTPEAQQWLRHNFGALPSPDDTIKRVFNPKIPANDRDLQILETVGDRVIEIVVIDRLLQDYPNLTKQELHQIKPKFIANDSLIRLARDTKLDRAWPERWALQNPLADRVEMIAAALVLDGHLHYAERFLTQLIKPSYIESILKTVEVPVSNTSRGHGTGSTKSRIIMEWLEERGLESKQHTPILALVPAALEYGRQRDMLSILGRAAVEAAVTLLAYIDCAGHAPKHFDNLVKHHLRDGIVRIESAGEVVSVTSPEFLLIMGLTASRLGFGKVFQLFRDDPSFHSQLREKMPIERHPAAKSRGMVFHPFNEVWPSNMMPAHLAHELTELRERRAQNNAIADEELRLRAALKNQRY